MSDIEGERGAGSVKYACENGHTFFAQPPQPSQGPLGEEPPGGGGGPECPDCQTRNVWPVAEDG